MFHKILFERGVTRLLPNIIRSAELPVSPQGVNPCAAKLEFPDARTRGVITNVS